MLLYFPTPGKKSSFACPDPRLSGVGAVCLPTYHTAKGFWLSVLQSAACMTLTKGPKVLVNMNWAFLS